MMFKRLSLFTLALFLFGAASAFAGSLWGEFEGLSKIRLMVNGLDMTPAETDVPPVLVGGSAMLPARTVSDALKAVVTWDQAGETLSIFKPNVHMFVARDVGPDYSIKQTFGKVKQNDKVNLVVFAQVDNLKTNISRFRISIEAPNGTQAVEPHEDSLPDRKESFWYTQPFTVLFDQAGEYKVKFSIKLDDFSDYTVVSEKAIVSVSE